MAGVEEVAGRPSIEVESFGSKPSIVPERLNKRKTKLTLLVDENEDISNRIRKLLHLGFSAHAVPT